MSSIRCPECNLASWATAVACKRCGYFFQPVPADAAQSQSFQSPLGEEHFVDSNQVNNANRQSFQAPNYQTPPHSLNAPSYSQNYGQTNHQSYYQPNYQTPKQKSGMAITSMVLGLVGCFLTAPIGLILGIVSLVKANRYPQEYGGKGFAIAGVVLNGFGILMLPIIAAIAVPNLLAARRAANEGSAISSIRTISAAEATYMSTIGARCGDLKTLAASKLVDPALANGEKSGYRFMVVNLPTARGGCEIHATPLASSHGTRSFYYSTEDGVIRAASKNGLFASASDAPIDNSNFYEDD